MTEQECIDKLRYLPTPMFNNDIDEAKRMAIKALEEVQQYRMEEEQGLLLRLPCPIGSEVWRIVNQRDNFTDQTYKIALRTTFRVDMLNQIGKTVFLSYEEANEMTKK